MYSPFNDYWLSRIDGFRRLPLESLPAQKIEKKAKPDPVFDVSDERIP
jgi:hypothetical protein